ncbi:MAG: hypothetical protein M0Z98_13065 [Actinomycetales bacterium]|nr:hypothetical protein [Actinomycetales bacterium]
MRLLLRGPAAGLDPSDSDADAVVAASPDTPGRRPWEWDVRLTRRPEGQSYPFDGAGIGSHHVDVRVRPDAVSAELRALSVEGPTSLVRDERELWVIVVESGSLRHEHVVLATGDVLVCEGDDPLVLDVAPEDAGAVTLAVVALRRTDGRSLRWVP